MKPKEALELIGEGFTIIYRNYEDLTITTHYPDIEGRWKSQKHYFPSRAALDYNALEMLDDEKTIED